MGDNMEYFRDGDILLSDFDGVYLDSQERFNKAMKREQSFELWTKYLNSINWKEFLKECKEMPGATDTFLELQKLGILRGFITKIHSFEEGVEKSIFIRDKGLKVPLYYVLPHQSKSLVYVPNSHTILLEDKIENALDWEQNGGKYIVYDKNISSENQNHVKSLKHLLK